MSVPFYLTENPQRWRSGIVLRDLKIGSNSSGTVTFRAYFSLTIIAVTYRKWNSNTLVAFLFLDCRYRLRFKRCFFLIRLSSTGYIRKWWLIVNKVDERYQPRFNRNNILSSVADPDPHGSAFKKSFRIRIRIQEVKKPRKCTGSWGEYRTGRSKVRILL